MVVNKERLMHRGKHTKSLDFPFTQVRCPEIDLLVPKPNRVTGLLKERSENRNTVKRNVYVQTYPPLMLEKIHQTRSFYLITKK